MGVRYVLHRLIVCLQYWPQLAACYLLGVIARTGAIELAAWAGHDNDVWASLIMPMAGLARLGSFVAMFLVLRPAFPELKPVSSLVRVNIFGSVVMPFVAVYLAWKMFKEDWLAFEARSLVYRAGEAMAAPDPSRDLHPGTLPASPVVWLIIGAALLARLALNRIDEDRLPSWALVVRVYIDFLWVFLVLTFSVNKGLTLLIDPSGWIRQRRVVVWMNDVVDSIFGSFHPLQVVGNLAGDAARIVFGGAAIPLLWLAIAGIVYGISTQGSWQSAARRVGGRWADAVLDKTSGEREELSRRWKALPRKVQEQGRAEALDRIGKFRPVTDSLRLIAHAGIPALAAYVLAYLVLAWLDTSGSFYGAQLGPGYLFRGMAWLLGPHPISFWNGFGDTLVLISHLIIEPLRICLVAVMFGYCVRHASATVQEQAPAVAGSQP